MKANAATKALLCHLAVMTIITVLFVISIWIYRISIYTHHDFEFYHVDQSPGHLLIYGLFLANLAYVAVFVRRYRILCYFFAFVLTISYLFLSPVIVAVCGHGFLRSSLFGEFFSIDIDRRPACR